MLEAMPEAPAIRIAKRRRARRQELGRDETTDEMAERLTIQVMSILEDDLEHGDWKAKSAAKELIVRAWCKRNPGKAAESPMAPEAVDQRIDALLEDPPPKLAQRLAAKGWKREAA